MPKGLRAHNFPEVYQGLGLNLSTLGCVMLNLVPLKNMYSIEFEGADSVLYYAKDKSRFWIDGWVADKVAHVTLLYGLIETAKNYEWHIKKVLRGWKLESVEINDVGYFDSPYPDEPYWCIVAHIRTDPKLIEGHQRLEMLPHVDTFPGYRPHMTIAYIKRAQGDAYRDRLIQHFKDLWIGKKLTVKRTINLGGNKN
jgi:2'-5' RNA ligase